MHGRFDVHPARVVRSIQPGTVITMPDSDTTTDRTGIKRRDYLAMSAVGATGLAGCLGGGGGEPTPTEGEDGMDSPTPTASPPSQQEEIPIASFLPLSGAGSPFGPGQQAGFNIAAEDVNDAGGTNKGTIRPINRDTETKPSRAAAKLKDVISSENIPAFCGTWSSGVSATLAPIAADNQVFQMGCGTTSPLLAEQGWREAGGERVKFFGRTSPNDGMQGIAVARILNDIIQAEKASFIHVDNPYGAGLAQAASRGFDGETTAMIGLPKEVSDYAAVLDEAFADDPDALVLVVYPPNGESLLKQWNRGGYGGTIVSAEALFLHDLFDRLADIMAGSYVTTIRPDKTPSWDYFNGEMKKRGQEVTTFSSHTYDALFLEALAIHQASEVSGLEIARNVVSVSRSPGEKIFSGSDEFQKAKDLIDDGQDINYQGASSATDLHQCFKEPFNQFAINQIVEGTSDDPAKVETVQTIPASFFKGKVYTQDQIDQYCQ